MRTDRLAAVARVLVDEVHRSTPVRLAYTLAPWHDDGADDSDTVYGVVHLAGRTPVRDPDAYFGVSQDWTQTIFAWNTDMGFPDTFEQMLVEVGSEVAYLVQVELWRMRLDPSWPPCPEHAGRHPMRPTAEPLEHPSADRAVSISATWRCYQPVVSGDSYETAYGPTAIPIGRLSVRDGVSAMRQ